MLKLLPFLYRTCLSLWLMTFIISCQPKQQSIPLHLPPLFSDQMVLQQQGQAIIWGKYNPNEAVKIAGSWGAEVRTLADKQGKWTAKLPGPEAGGPFTLTITTADSTLIIQDIMAGEVWLASGQSNMEMSLKGWPPRDPLLNSAEEIASANYPQIRMFTVERNISAAPLDELRGSWEAASPATAGDFSATAYFFARRLHQELGVPIGIIHSSWGGTEAEAWTSEGQLRELGDFNNMLPSSQKGKIEEIEAWFAALPRHPIPDGDSAWDSLNLGDLAVIQADFQDQDWDEIELPGRFDVFPTGAMDGVIWFRKTFEVQELSSDYVLTLGAVDDMDITYINGQRIGSMLGSGKWNVPRSYQVPRSVLAQGKNTIVIRAIDTGGGGSIGGPLQLKNNAGSTISLEGSWRYKVIAEIHNGAFYAYELEASGFAERPALTQLSQHTPTVLFNAMIHPLIPYEIKGVIWYQGESNVGRAAQYQRLFPAMIKDWRSHWEKTFPFYYVQIAPYHYNPNPDPSTDVSQKLREAQRLSLKAPKTGMVVTMDIGNYENIHPANKQEVGKRLAGWALAKDYGKDLVFSGPLFKQAEQAGNSLVIYFDHIGSGLMAGEDGLIGFEIAGAEGKYFPAEARIEGEKVVLSNPAVELPLHARYAWRDHGIASLFNEEGLPASTFCSEK